MHSNARREVIAACRALFDRGLVYQPDGGYLTDAGVEALAHAQSLAGLLNANRAGQGRLIYPAVKPLRGLCRIAAQSPAVGALPYFLAWRRRMALARVPDGFSNIFARTLHALSVALQEDIVLLRRGAQFLCVHA